MAGKDKGAAVKGGIMVAILALAFYGAYDQGWIGGEEEADLELEKETGGQTKVNFVFTNFVNESGQPSTSINVFADELSDISDYDVAQATAITTATTGRSTKVLTQGKHTILPNGNGLAYVIVDSSENVYYGYTLDVTGDAMDVQLFVVDPIEGADNASWVGSTASAARESANDNLVAAGGNATFYSATHKLDMTQGKIGNDSTALSANSVYETFISFDMQSIGNEGIIDAKLEFERESAVTDDIDEWYFAIVDGTGASVSSNGEIVYFPGVLEKHDTEIIVRFVVETASSIDSGDTAAEDQLGELILTMLQGSPEENFKIKLTQIVNC